MIYYIKLLLSYDYSGKISGHVLIQTATDAREKVIDLDINCLVDSDLDALVTAVDSNALLPTQLVAISSNCNFCYDIERAVTDTIDLNTLYGLIVALNA